jgi:hypothetical protein
MSGCTREIMEPPDCRRRRRDAQPFAVAQGKFLESRRLTRRRAADDQARARVVQRRRQRLRRAARFAVHQHRQRPGGDFFAANNFAAACAAVSSSPSANRKSKTTPAILLGSGQRAIRRGQFVREVSRDMADAQIGDVVFDDGGFAQCRPALSPTRPPRRRPMKLCRETGTAGLRSPRGSNHRPLRP